MDGSVSQFHLRTQATLRGVFGHAILSLFFPLGGGVS